MEKQWNPQIFLMFDLYLLIEGSIVEIAHFAFGGDKIRPHTLHIWFRYSHQFYDGGYALHFEISVFLYDVTEVIKLITMV